MRILLLLLHIKQEAEVVVYLFDDSFRSRELKFDNVTMRIIIL